jgi:hypothetical protein
VSNDLTVIARIDAHRDNHSEGEPWHVIVIENAQELRDKITSTDVLTLCGLRVPVVRGHYALVMDGAPDEPDCPECIAAQSGPNLIDEIEQYLKTHAKEPALA